MIKNIWEKWKLTAEKIGNFQMKVVFSILYYVLIFPLGIVMNYFNDFLGTHRFPNWGDVEDNSSNLSKLKDQF
jgi:hypothetical protein